MKNIILIVITIIAVAALLIGAMSMDSESILQYILAGAGLLWIGLFVYVNKDRMEEKYK